MLTKSTRDLLVICYNFKPPQESLQCNYAHNVTACAKYNIHQHDQCNTMQNNPAKLKDVAILHNVRTHRYQRI